MSAQYTGSAAWNPADLASLDELTLDITVTGAVLGDFVEASFTVDVTDLEINAQVVAADSVTVQLQHMVTGGNLNLGAGTCYVIVTSKSGQHI